MPDWGDKDADMENWHHRGHLPGPHRSRIHGWMLSDVILVLTGNKKR